MWGNHLNSCWRFQFSPEPYKTKSALQKRVCRSLTIAFYRRSRTSGRPIRRWAEQRASKIRDSFWCFDSVSYSFVPVDETISFSPVQKFVHFIRHRRCFSEYLQLPAHTWSISSDMLSCRHFHQKRRSVHPEVRCCSQQGMIPGSPSQQNKAPCVRS